MLCKKKPKTGHKPVFLLEQETKAIERQVFGKLIIKPRDDIAWIGVKHKRKVVAYVGYWIHGKNCKIVIMGVVPQFRGLGLQRLLIEQVLLVVRGQVDRIWAEVGMDNQHSFDNFAKMGFSTEIIVNEFCIVSKLP